MDYTNVAFTEDKLTEQRRTSVNGESEYAVEGFVLCSPTVTEVDFK